MERFLIDLGIGGILLGLALILAVITWVRRREWGFVFLALAVGSFFAAEVIVAMSFSAIRSGRAVDGWVDLPGMLQSRVAPMLTFVALLLLAIRRTPPHPAPPKS